MAIMHYRLLLDDIDAAGVVFGPRLITLAHHAVELRLIETPLNVANLLREQRWAMPLVHISADFSAPAAHGQQLNFTVSVAELGERSVALTIAVSNDHSPVARISQTHACLDLSTHRAAPWPQTLRSAWATVAAELQTL